MFTREELLRSPEYWFEEAQNELYRQVVEYKERQGINQTQLAEELGVTKGYVSQILKGEFNYTLKKLIEISLAIGQVPKIDYVPLAKVIADDAKSVFLQLHSGEPAFMPLSSVSTPNEIKSEVAEPLINFTSPVSTIKVAI